MKRILVFFSVLLVFSFSLLTLQASTKPSSAPYTNFSLGSLNNKANKVIITYKKEAPIQALSTNDYRLKKSPVIISTLSANKIQALLKDPNIKSIEIDHPIKADSITATPLKNIHTLAQTKNWGISTIKAPAAWANGYTGKGVKIAVLDSGAGPHSDLVLSGGVSFVGTGYNDVYGHGTHTAGIIAAQNNTIGIVGVAYDSSLYEAKVLSDTGGGSVSNAIAAIDWAIANKMDIISMSFSTPTYSQAFKDVCDKAYAAGILLVASAGNTGTLQTRYPSGFSSVIAVGATDSTNTIASYSTFGPQVEIAAPGSSIYSTYLNNGYAYMSGTSMATPFVAGALAIMKQENPTFTNVQLRNLLNQSALDLGTSGKDNYYGYGLLQIPAKP